jgi:hypothetical protein
MWRIVSEGLPNHYTYDSIIWSLHQEHLSIGAKREPTPRAPLPWREEGPSTKSTSPFASRGKYHLGHPYLLVLVGGALPLLRGGGGGHFDFRDWKQGFRMGTLLAS